MQAGDQFETRRSAELAASPRIFESSLLDKLSRVHHLVPLFLYGPVVLALTYVGARQLPAYTELTALAGGYVTWTLLEYLGHRFLFHFRAQNAWGRRVHFLIHGVHHDHPSDPLRLVMPPLMSLPIMTAAFVFFATVCGPALRLPVMAGFLIGYLIYDMLHFHLHHGTPHTRLGHFLRRRHLHHHFRDETSWFGVSAPWWDEIFATRPLRRATVRE